MSISVIDDAFIPEHLNTIKIVKVVGMGLAVIIQLFIGILTYSKIRRSDSRTGWQLPFLFFLSFVFALLFTIGGMISNLFWVLYGSHPAISVATSAVPFFYCFFLLSLLGTLVTRLYVTFQGTGLQMSMGTIFILTVIMVTDLISVICVCVGHTLIVFGMEDIGWILTYPTSGLFFFLYITGSALSVRLFVANLSKIAKMQRCSQDDASPKAQDTSLNSKQLTLLNLAAKYILLFFVEIMSTLLTYFLIIMLSFECRGLFMSVDLCVNLWCLHLQFALAKKHYQKCCGCLDSCCKAVVLRRTKKAIHKELLHVQAELAIEMSSASETHSVGARM